MGKYGAFARDAASAEAGITLREAFSQLLVLLWRDNEPDAVEKMWLGFARSPGSFAAEALEVLADAVAAPPADLLALLREHGWVTLYHDRGTPNEREYSFAEAVEWLRDTHDRFRAVYLAEHPAPGRRPGT